MKKTKKIIYSLMVLFLTLGIVFGNQVQAKADVADCPLGGKHYMKAKGIGWVYRGSTLVFRGYAYQCTNCGLAMITETDACEYGTIGRYIEFNPGYTLDNAGTSVDLSKWGFSIYYADKSIPGFGFHR